MLACSTCTSRAATGPPLFITAWTSMSGSLSRLQDCSAHRYTLRHRLRRGACYLRRRRARRARVRERWEAALAPWRSAALRVQLSPTAGPAALPPTAGPRRSAVPWRATVAATAATTTTCTRSSEQSVADDRHSIAWALDSLTNGNAQRITRAPELFPAANNCAESLLLAPSSCLLQQLCADCGTCAAKQHFRRNVRRAARRIDVTNEHA